MRDITDDFFDLYQPTAAIVVRQHVGKVEDEQPPFYLESYDIDPQGRPINAHPLTTLECRQLAQALYVERKEELAFLKPTGLLPDHVLYINPDPANGMAIWYTPPQARNLLFVDSLDIPSGTGQVPAMIWRATTKRLTVFALASDRKPTADTTLYLAPFFNVNLEGSVCMGNVDVRIKRSISLEAFTGAWESYFFNSYFSHTIVDKHVKGDIRAIWQQQVTTDQPFPTTELIRTKYTVKSLLPK